MKNTFLRSACLLLAVFSFSFSVFAQTEKQIPDEFPPLSQLKAKNELAEYLLELDSIATAYHAEMGEKPVVQTSPDEDLEQTRKTMQETERKAQQTWRKFVYLCNEERVDEAAAFLATDDHDIDLILALGRSDLSFALNRHITAPMCYDLLAKDRADEIVVRDFQLDLMLVKFVVEMRGDGTIPDHYYDAHCAYLSALCHAEKWDEAFEEADNLEEFFTKHGHIKEGSVLSDFSRSEIYEAKGDFATSLTYHESITEVLSEALEEKYDDTLMSMLRSVQEHCRDLRSKIAEK